MIEIRNLYKSYGDTPVLKGINFAIQDGDIFGLVGVSGAGKSTLLRCINGLETFDSGELIVSGTNIKGLGNAALRGFRRQSGIIFQQFSLLERKTVYENINFPMKCCRINRKKAELKIRELLELVELSDKINALPRELSGGQKQRVAIARALSTDPKILLCDEATSALDPNITASILSLLKKINAELGITIVVVTHQMDVVKAVCNKMAVLSHGSLKYTGDVQQAFINTPQVLDELLGEEGYHEELPEFNYYTVTQRNEEDKDILAQIALHTGLPFEVIWGGLDKYRESIVGCYTLRVRKESSAVLEEFLQERNAEWRKA